MPVAPVSPQFTQHPFSVGSVSVLGALSKLFEDAGATGVDTLLFAPPAATDVDGNGSSVARLVSVSSTACFARVTSAQSILAADKVQLVYKATGGREVVVAQATGAILAQGKRITLSPQCNFLMQPGDQGLYLRVVEAVVLGTKRLEGTVQILDVRGLTQTFEDVTAVESPIPAAGGNPALAQVVYENEDDGVVDLSTTSIVGGFFGAIHNYDSVAHTYQLFVTDGVIAIEISDTLAPPSIAAGAVELVALPALLPGWSVLVSLAVAPATLAPRFFMTTFKTNESVARTDQGGAF